MNDKLKANKELEKRVLSIIQNTTFHGVKGLMNSNYLKIVWFLGISFSVCFCAYELIISLITYLKYDVIVQLDYINDFNISFPAITFCNLQLIDYSKVMLEKNRHIRAELENLIKPFNLTDNFQINMEKVKELIDKGYQYKQIVEMINQIIITQMPRNLREEISYNIEDLFISCLFNNRVCGQEMFRRRFNTNFGNCFAFNTGLNATFHPIPIFNMSRPGFRNGLRLELSIGEQDFLPFWVSTNGIILSVHNTNVVPLLVEEGLRIRPGTETNLVITREIFYKLKSPYSDCLADVFSMNSYDSEFYRDSIIRYGIYRQKLCLNRCAVNRSLSSNLLLDYESFKQNPTDINNHFNSEEYKKCLEMCPMECESVNYRTSVNIADYSNDNYLKMLFTTRNRTQVVKNNVLLVNLYFETITYTQIKEIAEMPFSNLLANIGGKLGLFLGVSILSFLEIVEIIFEVIRHYILQIKFNPNISSVTLKF